MGNGKYRDFNGPIMMKYHYSKEGSYYTYAKTGRRVADSVIQKKREKYKRGTSKSNTESPKPVAKKTNVPTKATETKKPAPIKKSNDTPVNNRALMNMGAMLKKKR